ncbi:hypothetical protein LIER_17187 [Lithospermum erythrorhizon]|uniref:Maturase K n=1 Tax=Lithospermum erythrorhizon TaxID=34254 RepID=A0AAV3QET5_LITER
MYWKQKSSLKWELEGDRNFKFYHAFTKQKYKCNKIHGTWINGVWTEMKLVKNSAIDFFKDLLSSAGNGHQNHRALSRWLFCLSLIRTIILYKGYGRNFLFEPMINKIRERMASWQRKFLSIGGRITLLQAVLNSLPIYTLQVIDLPVLVISHIKRIINHFYGQENSGGDSRQQRQYGVCFFLLNISRGRIFILCKIQLMILVNENGY